MTVKVAISQNRRVTVYHTKDCKNVAKMRNYMELEKDEAEAKGLTECDDCAGNTDYSVSKDFSYYMAAKKAGQAND